VLGKAQENEALNQLASALRFIDILMKSGRSRYEAEDIAIEVLLAPADGAFSDNPPEPLSLDDQERFTGNSNGGRKSWIC
jgi:hypothetical protein